MSRVPSLRTAGRRHVALLRAVNVGGRNRLAMADLRSIVEGLGHTEVSTYIQSGNVVLTSAGTTSAGETSTAAIARGIHDAILAAVALDVAVMVRTAEQLRAAAAINPFVGRELEPAKLAVIFLSSAPTADAVAALDPARFAPDRFEVIGDHLFVHFPNGMGRSKFTTDYIERRLGVHTTARNLNTVHRLMAMADQNVP